MSQGFGLPTILGCLGEGEKLVGLNPENWFFGGSANLGQMDFIKNQHSWRQSLSSFSEDELRSFATSVHPEVLKKMLEWKMRLSPIPDDGPGAVYMISQLRECLKWLEEGKPVMRLWPEFILEKGVCFYKVGVTNNLAVSIDTINGDRVFMHRFNNLLPNSSLNLYKAITQIEDVLVKVGRDVPFTGVQIPCVYADIEAEMKWILGMINEGFFISYAQQKILFGMNQTGFAVREETAMTMRKGICLEEPKPPYILSPDGESFLFWRRRFGVSYPISMFQFTKDDFKDPGDLQKIVE